MNDFENGDSARSEKAKPQNADTWTRGLYMLAYAVIGHLLFGIVWCVVIIQFVVKLSTGELNRNLEQFSALLTRYAMQILEFLTFQSDDRPWPFGDTLRDD